jgi:hypothetical protein
MKKKSLSSSRVNGTLLGIIEFRKSSSDIDPTP